MPAGRQEQGAEKKRSEPPKGISALGSDKKELFHRGSQRSHKGSQRAPTKIEQQTLFLDKAGQLHKLGRLIAKENQRAPEGRPIYSLGQRSLATAALGKDQ